MNYIVFILSFISIGVVNTLNVTDAGISRSASEYESVVHFNTRNLIDFELPTFTFNNSMLSFQQDDSFIYVEGIIGISDDSKCKFGQVMSNSVYYRYYFRPSNMDMISGDKSHFIEYCFKLNHYDLTIPKFSQTETSHTKFVFLLYSDKSFQLQLGESIITVGCERITINNVFYDYTVINKARVGKCVEFYYTVNEITRQCQSNGEWEDISNNMICYPQSMPKITPTASDLSVSFSNDNKKIILNGKIKLSDGSSCIENHIDNVTYFYSLSHTNDKLDSNMKYKTIPYCFENGEISFDFEIDNNDTTIDKLVIQIYGNEKQQHKLGSVTYNLKCNNDYGYNAYWPSSYVGIINGVCNILHIWNNNNNSRYDYPNRICYGDGKWESLSEGCIPFTPDIQYDYNNVKSYFDKDNNTIVNGTLYINYITDCHLINDTVNPKFYLIISSNGNNQITNEIDSCLQSNNVSVLINNYKATKLDFKLCYDKNCNYILKATESRIYSCPSKTENNINYQQTLAGNSVNITSKDCTNFYIYNNDNYLRKCNEIIGWEESNQACTPVQTNFSIDLSNIEASIDKDSKYISLNGAIKVIDNNQCKYPSKPDSLYLVYEISSLSFVSETSSNVYKVTIPYCFENNNNYNILINNLKSKNQNDFNLNVKLCTAKDKCKDVNLLSQISKPFGCRNTNNKNYMFNSTLIGDKEGRCKDLYEYTEAPLPIIGRCNENGKWEYPTGECILPTYIDSLIDIDLSNLTASIVNDKLILNGYVNLTDKYNCNSTYKPNQLIISYSLTNSIYTYTNQQTLTTDYCFKDNIYNIKLTDYYGNNPDGVVFNIKVYTSEGIVLGSNNRRFGCAPELKDGQYIIWPVSLFGSVIGECVALYEFEIAQSKPTRNCTINDWDNYNKKCYINSNFTIDTSLLETSIDSLQRTVVKGKIKVEDLNKGTATYQPNDVTFVYYYSDTKYQSSSMGYEISKKRYPFSNNNIETVDISSYTGSNENYDELNMKLCLDSTCTYIYANKFQILVCKKTNSDTINWKKTVVNTTSLGECIKFYYYPDSNGISVPLPPRTCRDGGVWDNYDKNCVLMKFPQFDINVIDMSSSSNWNYYTLQFKAKLVLTEAHNIPNYGQIRLYCKLDGDTTDNLKYEFCGNINYKNETNIHESTYITDEISIRNINNDNHYLYLKLCINTLEDNSCKYQIQDKIGIYYLKCDSSSSSNATWKDSLVNSYVKGECNRKYIYNGNGNEPLRNCTANNTWNNPEDICVMQTNPEFSYEWKSFKSYNLKNNGVTFQGTLIVNDDSKCLKYQKTIYYQYCFNYANNVNCDSNNNNVVYGSISYCFSNNKAQIEIPKTEIKNMNYFFYIQFCTNKECKSESESGIEYENEIISNYNKSVVCVNEILGDPYNMNWPTSLPDSTVKIECAGNPPPLFNGVDENPERKCGSNAEWSELQYQCEYARYICPRETYKYNNFPQSPAFRVFHSPCNTNYHNLVPKNSIMYNKARRNCTEYGEWSEIENPCYSNDYRDLTLDTSDVMKNSYVNSNNEFCVNGTLNVVLNKERSEDIYFMNITIYYYINNNKIKLSEFTFINTTGIISSNEISNICFNTTNKITFSLYYKDEDYTIQNKELILGCFYKNHAHNNFLTTSYIGKNKGYCDKGYISEAVPISECKSNGEWSDEISNKCFFPNFKYYYLNLNPIKVVVNETHFMLSNYFSIENNKTCDDISYSVLLIIFRIKISPALGDSTYPFLMNSFTCKEDLITNVAIDEIISIKSTEINTISFGLFSNFGSIHNATRVLGCSNYNYLHNNFPTSKFGSITGKCDYKYISHAPNGLPSNICNEDGKWNENITYPCFKPTYKETKFNFSELVVIPKENEFCLNGKVLTDYYENECGDVETPFNLTISYKFKNINNDYQYLDSFIYHCQNYRISETIYPSPVCVFSNISNEITYQLKYNDEIITTSSYILGCNKNSFQHNNFNTSLVGNHEGYCDDEYISESVNKRPIRQCLANGEWSNITYICIPTDYKYLQFDSSKSIIYIKNKTNFCLTNVLVSVYNRTECSDLYYPLQINIMYLYANETVNNTINTNYLHYFSSFIFTCKYGVISENDYPNDFCISSKTSTFIKFVMMYKDEIITIHDIYLGCDQIIEKDNQFDASLMGKQEGKCNTGYISLSQNGNPQRECLYNGEWSEITFPCIKDDYSLLRFNLNNLAITLNNKQEFCINGNLLSNYEGKCDSSNYNVTIKLYYQLNGTGVENFYQDFLFNCKNGNYSVTRFNADLCVDSTLYNKVTFHLYYSNIHITNSLLYLGCMRQIINGSEWEASLIGTSSGVCLNGYTTLNQNISRPVRECLYDGNYGFIIEPCVQIPSTEGFLTGTVKYAVFGISILLLLICLLLLCCCLLCYACKRNKKKHEKKVRNEGNIDTEEQEGEEKEDEEQEGDENDNDNNEENKDFCGTNVIFNNKNDIESIQDPLSPSIHSGSSANNVKKGILKTKSSKFGKKSSANSLINNNRKSPGIGNRVVPSTTATMYSMRTNQLHPSKSSNFANHPNPHQTLQHFKSSHNVLRSNSKVAPSLPGSTSDNAIDDDNYNPTFSMSNIGLSNPSLPARVSSSGYNPRFTSATLGLSNPGSAVNSDTESVGDNSSGNELLVGSTASSLKQSNTAVNENIPPKFVMNKRQSIGHSKSSAFPPPPPQPQILPHQPSFNKSVKHYNVKGGAPIRSKSCRIPKRINKPEPVDSHPFGVASPLKRSKSTLFRENKNVGVNDRNTNGIVRQLSKKNSSKAMELDLDVEDII